MLRAGVWPDVLRQGAWPKLRLGEKGSGRFVSGHGCLLTCYAQALRDFEVDPAATPASILAATLDAKRRIWFGAEPVQAELARFYGLTAGDVVRAPQPAQAIRDALVKALEQGLAILNVDHTGDERADHFVLGRRVVETSMGPRVMYADPATGAEDTIDLRTLSGQAEWNDGKVRIYRLHSVRALAHLPR